MNKPKITVIIPMYNAEKYINRCVDSILNQTLKDIEIILIDDCSKDKTYELAKEYENKFSQITLIKNSKNRWQCFGRNLGIRKAKGEFIAFVDVDDWLEPQMYEKLYNEAISKNRDVVKCRFKAIYSNEEKILQDFMADANPEEFEKNLPIILGSNLYVCWNGIYKREFLKTFHIMFPIKTKYEDIAFIYQCYIQTNKISYINDCLYNYDNTNINSDCRNINSLYVHYFRNMAFVKKFLDRKNLFEKYKPIFWYSYYLLFEFATSYLNKKEKDIKFKEFLSHFKHISKKGVVEFIDKYPALNVFEFKLFMENTYRFKFIQKYKNVCRKFKVLRECI